MFNLFSWLIGSKVGRVTALIMLSLVSSFLILWSAFRKGADSEKAKQTASRLKTIQERIAIDDSITKKPLDVRRSELARWMRDDQ